MVCFLFLLLVWFSMNLIVVDEVFVERINFFDVFGRVRIGGEIKVFFKFLKVMVYLFVYLNGLFLWSSWFNGFVIFEYLRIKCL